MWRTILLVLILIISNGQLLSQKEIKAYFQQDVDFKIDVTLNDKKHALHGFIEIDYKNNSTESLKKIAFHLWPNAFKNKSTAFVEQQIHLGKVGIYQTPASSLGFIDSLKFSANGKSLRMDIDPEHIDIAWVRLKEPLKPGETIGLKTPFFVKLPGSLSRLGHVGESYQMTQWYPKPAVFDRTGWHTMPYLDQGEFYSEFGNFDVSITLPDNYVVAATGDLQTESEQVFINEKVIAELPFGETSQILPDTFPPSSKDMKTIHFTASNVHDFAWFADKRFVVRKSNVTLENGTSVETFAYFTKSQSALWKKAVEYLNRSVKFYSDHVGPYPYRSATAVQAVNSAGGGMEYPMITLIGPVANALDLDDVITHEVGHNWFYGMLGSNERDFAWMDEGLNSFYERKYLDKYYPNRSPFVTNFLMKKGNLRDISLMIVDRQKQKKLLPPSTPVEWQDENSYYLNAYEYPAIAFEMLEQYMGKESFSNAMKSYFNTWQYKHPGPDDLQTVFEEKCMCDLNWLFVEMMVKGLSLDYKIKRGVRPGSVIIQNKGEVKAPIEIIGFRDEEPIWRQWVDGFSGEKEIDLTNSTNDISHLTLYDTSYFIDVSPFDNFLGGKNLNSSAPMKINFLAGVQNTSKKELFISPMLMYNQYDKGMIGGWIHNDALPAKPFRFSLMPMYSFESKHLVGLGELRYNTYPQGGIFSKISARLNFRKFSFDFDSHYEFINQYSKIEPEFIFTIKPKYAYKKNVSQISYRYALINQSYGSGLNFEEKLFEILKRNYYLNELAFTHKRSKALAPSLTKAALQQGAGFLKMQASFHQQLVYDKPSRGLFFHLFGGVFLQNDAPDANVNFLFNGTASSSIFAKDYFHDELLIGRNASSGILSQQIFLRDAELKTLTNIGITNKVMFGAGVSSNLPIPLPIHFYADMAFYRDPFLSEMNISYSAGFSLVVRKNFIEVYFPVFESKDIRESFTYERRDKYLERVSFLFNLKGFRPLENSEQFFDFMY